MLRSKRALNPTRGARGQTGSVWGAPPLHVHFRVRIYREHLSEKALDTDVPKRVCAMDLLHRCAHKLKSYSLLLA